MGTSNFHRVNASKIYAVLMNQPADEDGEYYAPEEWEIDEFVGFLRELLGEVQDADFYPDGNDPHELRSYPSHVIGRIITEANFAGGLIPARIIVTCVMRSGYYEGACLDWHYTEEVNDEEIDGDFDITDYDLTNEEMGVALFNIEHWADGEYKRLTTFVEKVYSDLSNPMEVVATFSNGETIYKMAN
jgi:hypothetical protein